MVCAGAAGSDRGSVSFSDRIMGAKVVAVEFGGRQEEEEEEKKRNADMVERHTSP